MNTSTPPSPDQQPVATPANSALAEQTVPNHGVPGKRAHTVEALELPRAEAERVGKFDYVGGAGIAGLAAGAAVGAAIGGPVGALVGGTVGTIAGVLSGEAADHTSHAESGVSPASSPINEGVRSTDDGGVKGL